MLLPIKLIILALGGFQEKEENNHRKDWHSNRYEMNLFVLLFRIIYSYFDFVDIVKSMVSQ